MRFSLVLATVNRTQELERFLESLDAQTYRGFELIVVDQNTDDRLRSILESYEGRFPIFHLRSEGGLSRARNVGLEYVTGDIVAFPDDDCWYPPDLIKRVTQFFKEHPDVDGLTGRSIDESGESSATRWEKNGGLIDPINVWRRSISFSIFLKVEVINKVGNFDQYLGTGSGTPWGSGEEIDYFVKRGGRILLVTSALLDDLEPSWNIKRRFSNGFAGMLKGEGDFRAYYGMRNGAYYDARYLKKHAFMFWLNRWIYMVILFLLSILLKKRARYRLLREAVEDGLSGRLGIHERFPL